MKTKYSSRFRNLHRAGALLAGTGLALQAALAADSSDEEDKALHEYRNWIDVSVGGMSIGG